ncbi:polysaccharide pyruvyl transferase family protein [Amphritea atlantica]|uniref:Polysaccharide pyruvyl transferase family protein n=1 Tax=Amphritea atlantica TaxID=355243 RepID=A0ABY5GXZ1_9GAMM|nr:polysaccharide pyruvyl transferase family protein [Amphritea atlantica]
MSGLFELLNYKYSKIKRRQLLDGISQAINIKDYLLLEKLIFSGLGSRYENVRDVAKAKKVILELQNLVERDISEESRIPLWWSDSPYPGNLGDSLNPWLIDGLTGIPPIKVGLNHPGVMLAIGSTAQKARDNSVIWGSGFISKDSQVNSKSEYCAVRGPLSRTMVNRANGSCPAIYGDPALFMPLIFPRLKKSTGRIGVIPHYIHENQIKNGDYLNLSVKRASKADFRKFVDDLCECSYVFSSSLHGLIIARAYGIPARRVVFPGRSLSGDDMKFEDYYSGVGVKRVSDGVDLSGLPDWDEARLKEYRAPDDPVAFDGNNLLSSFPYSEHLLGDVVNRAGSMFG